MNARRVPLSVGVEHPPGSGSVVLRVSGEVDARTAVELRNTIQRQDQGQRLVIDLHPTTFLDTAGLEVLIRAAQNHPDFRLVCATGPCLRLLEVSGLRGHFRVADSVDAALGDS